ncbi:hypothetical protein CMO91_04055 [Candidatus Woesearchaeota archaeon]|nr:hypothetical protein [Candidatus Woesearchaeota archaeon]|tara:strand:+ start:118 stop:867 length:750 start_codon:yes stop_codon:yes gene_type:complete
MGTELFTKSDEKALFPKSDYKNFPDMSPQVHFAKAYAFFRHYRQVIQDVEPLSEIGQQNWASMLNTYLARVAHPGYRKKGIVQTVGRWLTSPNDGITRPAPATLIEVLEGIDVIQVDDFGELNELLLDEKRIPPHTFDQYHALVRERKGMQQSADALLTLAGSGRDEEWLAIDYALDRAAACTDPEDVPIVWKNVVGVCEENGINEQELVLRAENIPGAAGLIRQGFSAYWAEAAGHSHQPKRPVLSLI